MRYRRDDTEGATYFFTVVTHRRRPWFAERARIDTLRSAFAAERKRRPFNVDAIVILPDHIHSIWTLPEGDADFSIRWRNIKSAFTAHIQPEQRPAPSASRRRQSEQGIWQRRFWEHRIRDDADFARHVDYIHYNPVKHGYARVPVDWPYSSIHRYLRAGILPSDWGCGDIDIPTHIPE
jgi:putative transposase